MGTHIALAAPAGLYAVAELVNPVNGETRTSVIGSVVAIYVRKDPEIGRHTSKYVLSNGQIVDNYDDLGEKNLMIMTQEEIDRTRYDTTFIWEHGYEAELPSELRRTPPPPPRIQYQ